MNAAQAKPIGIAELGAALLTKPRLILRLLRAAARGASQGVRSDDELIWLISARRVTREIPDAATGVAWHGEEDFVAALEPHLTKSTRAVEVGAGAGRVSRLVAPCVSELICADVSRTMLEEAKENLAGTSNVSFSLTRGLTLDGLPRDSFDLVYAHDVLVTFDPDPALAMLDAMRGLLRPEGICVVSFFTADRPAWARDQLERVRRAATAGHFGSTHPRTYVAAQVDALMGFAGFEVVDRRYGESADDAQRAHYILTGRAAAGGNA